MNAPNDLPWYQPVGREVEVFEHASSNRLPVLLKGPTGCGKSRFVEHMAAKLGRPLITVACHDDTSAADLLGRWLLRGGQTVWQDGPVTRAVRTGAILYLDEIAEARPDVTVVLHPLTDHRRELFLDRHDERLVAPEDFLLVVSYNPGYQRGLKDLKPSTRQRFVHLVFDYPEPALEAKIVVGETGCSDGVAKRLAALANKMRAVEHLGGAERPSTRLLVDAATLISSGLEPRLACRVGLVNPLTDDLELADALNDLVSLVF
ncbi:MAG: nitric oxide reductase NorQ protein [Kiritimatiellia bacterium]|jgi:nitric oxide reductase NorQ protein